VTTALSNDQPFGVWILDTVQAPDASDFASIDAEEKHRCVRFARDRDRHAFVKTRSALRGLLGDAIGVAPNSIRFAQNPWGKPVLAAVPAVPVDFSVSHTDGLSAIALSDGRRIGIDVERDRAIPDRHRIAADVFGTDLACELSCLADAAQDLVFLRLWTAVEAFVKATGTGFAGLKGIVPFSLSPGSGTVRLERESSPTDGPSWILFPLSLPAGYSGSVVIEGLGPVGALVVPQKIRSSSY
jgi:4'-phosphopantetheinyl transferase